MIMQRLYQNLLEISFAEDKHLINYFLMQLLPSHASDRNTHMLTRNDIIQIDDFWNHKNKEFELYFSVIMFMFDISQDEDNQLKNDYEMLKFLKFQNFYDIACECFGVT